MEPGSSLEDVAASYGLSEAQTASLAGYVDLIAGWRHGNITGLREREEILRVLVGDSLSLLDVTEVQQRVGDPWVDLGAGAGLPGIPLALALPSAELTLLESAAGKCRFLEAAVRATELAARTRVVCERSERYAAAGQPGREAFAVVFARAVAPLPVLVELAAPLLRRGGVLVASKTRRALSDEGRDGEAAAALCGLTAGRVVALPRSPLGGAVCAVYAKNGPTPARLPRRPGLAAKRPLTAGEARPGAAAGAASIGGSAKGLP